MSDSHKISLLDLQTRDMSQYGKKNLGQTQGASRNVESSYRKQLSESLSKKQSDPSSDKKPELESRSIDLQPDKKRPENNRFDTSGTPASQEKRAEARDQQSEVSQQDETVVDTDSSVSTSVTEKSTSTQESEPQNSSGVIESTEEGILTQQEINQPVKQKEPSYSLFDSTFVGQTEGSLEQEVTTENVEIHPPANFQFVEDQTPVNPQVQVTETSPGEAIPIPEGLAELLKQQGVDTSQIDSDKIVLTDNSTIENQELDSILQKSDELTNLQESKANSIDSDVQLEAENHSELKLTAELQQAIQENSSGDSVGTSDEQNVDIQSIVQQQSLHSRSEEQSSSPSVESENGENASDQESLQGISDTVIEQVTQGLAAEQTDATESNSRDTEQATQKNEEVNQSRTNQNPNISLNAQGQYQIETAKTSPVSQENVLSAENDQPVSQQPVVSQAASPSGTQSSTPVAPAVDIKQIEQLVERIVGNVRQSQSTGQQLKIRLGPPELGTLQIEVSLKNGEYTAKLDVQNNQVQKVINDNMAQLRDTLAKSGIAIDRIEVNINTDSSEDHHSSQSDTQSKSGGEFHSEDFSDNTSDSDQRQQERSSIEESAKRDEEIEQADEDNPQVARSQGVATEHVEEIDVQI